MVRRRMLVIAAVTTVLLFGLGVLFTPAIATAFTLGSILHSPNTPTDSGFFVDTGQALATTTINVQLADFNGDGAVDLIFDNTEHGGEVWLNSPGTLNFAPTGQTLGKYSPQVMAVGDIDGDGDVDVLAGTDALGANARIKIWKNDGTGMFTANAQPLDASFPNGLALEDVDGDNDLDIFVARGIDLPDQVWLNNGTGTFTNSGQALDGGDARDVELGDLDGDGDLDAFVVNVTENKVWLNNGAGIFSDSGQVLAANWGTGVTLGDIDRDGDLDAATANENSTNRLWQNNGNGVFSQLSLPESGTNSQNITFVDVDVDGDLDIFVSRAELNLVFFNMGGVQQGAIGTYVDSFQLLTGYTHNTAFYDFDGDHDPDAITGEGVTSRVWRNEGLSSLGVYYGIRDDVFAETERGRHYTTLYYSHTTEIAAQFLKNPPLAVTAYDTLNVWKPNLETLLTENRGDAIITQAQVDQLDSLLTELSAVASPELQQAIATERAALPPFNTFVGQSMSTAAQSILGEPTFTEQTFLPLLYNDRSTLTPDNLNSVAPVMGCSDCGIERLYLIFRARIAGLPNPCTTP